MLFLYSFYIWFLFAAIVPITYLFAIGLFMYMRKRFSITVAILFFFLYFSGRLTIGLFHKQRQKVGWGQIEENFVSTLIIRNMCSFQCVVEKLSYKY